MLYLMMMGEHASLQEHFVKIKDIREQFMAIDRKIEEDMVVIALKS
jgi:hypothetical protein